MPYKRFITPREIIHGWGALQALKYTPTEKTFIVTDKIMAKLGYPDRIKSILSEKGAECQHFDEIEADPSLDTVKKCLAQVLEFKPDLIIGLGGGSPIDAAKAVWAFYEHPDLAEMEWDELRRTLPRRRLQQKARYIAIPTTSGTGSEVSFGAVISNNAVDPPDKRIMFNLQFAADTTIVDAELAASMPPDVTAATGYDALVHAVESYVGGETPIIIDGMAIPAIKAIMKWLPVAYADGANTAARENMHLAATMAMAACTNSYGSLNHDMAHQLGSYYHLTHGVANAIMLGYFLAWLYAYNPERLAMLAKELGLDVKNTRDGAQKLITTMNELRKKVGLPGSLKEAGIEESRLMSDLDNLAQATLDSGVSQQRPTPDEVKDIFLKAWKGAEPALPPE